MDIVKVVLGVGPWLVDIVDFKASIRRDEVWLDRRDINSSHLGGWMLIREVATPGLALDL